MFQGETISKIHLTEWVVTLFILVILSIVNALVTDKSPIYSNMRLITLFPDTNNSALFNGPKGVALWSMKWVRNLDGQSCLGFAIIIGVQVSLHTPRLIPWDVCHLP